MENIKSLRFRHGNPAYLLYKEKRCHYSMPIGFFGRVVNLKTCPDNQTFDIKGYELLVPNYTIWFDKDLIIKNNEMPSIVVPRDCENTPRAFVQEIEKNIEIAASLDDFFVLLKNRRFEPYAGLYDDMQKALTKIRRA